MSDQELISKETERILNIRHKNRIDLHKSQINKRLSTIDRQRCGLSEIVATIKDQELLTEKDVQGLSSRIKRRKAATSTDLKRLSAAFLHNLSNVETFLRIPGALNIIIKEFSGSDVENQVLACECLCNLSLGPDISSKKVAQLAGSYLVLYLDNISNTRLVETCLWVIQNLLLSGEKTQKVLMAQGLSEKLLALVSHGVKTSEMTNVAEETLAIMVTEASKELPAEFHTKVLGIVMQKLKHDTIFLFYVLYSTLMQVDFHVDTEILSFSVKISINELIFVTQNSSKSFDYARVLMGIRIITNSLLVSPAEDVEKILKSLFDQLEQHQITISSVLNAIFKVDNEQICCEALWMLSGLSKYLNHDTIESLEIPIKYL